MLTPKLSDALTAEQKISKINNLLTKWRKGGLIRNTGSDRAPRWTLAEKKE
jgi:ATP-dependent DNA helicase RecG